MPNISTREKILTVARKHFVKHGYAGTSMTQIGKQAGITHSLLFHYFTNKANLWQEVKQMIIDQENEAENVIPSTNLTFEKFLAKVVNNMIQFYRNSTDLTRMLQWQRLEYDSNKDIGVGFYSRSVKRWLTAFKHYQDKGDIVTNISLECLLTALFSLVVSFVVDNNRLLKTKNAQKKYIRFCVQMLLVKCRTF